MKKIVWLSNFVFSDCKSNGSGTWIEAMGRHISSCNYIQLYNISIGNVERTTSGVYFGIKQWVLPLKPLLNRPFNSLPPESYVNEICRIISDIKPNLIHVWGIERFWGLLTARKILNYPTLLEIQGITSAMVPYVKGCLTVREQIKCIGPKEFLRPKGSMWYMAKRYEDNCAVESEIVRGHGVISYQSEWIYGWLRALGCTAKVHKTRMILRDQFLTASSWVYGRSNHKIFSSCGWSPNKGLHILVKACIMLKEDYPDIELNIAGDFQTGLRQSGYTKFVLKMIMRSGIKCKILGAIDAERMAEEIRSSCATVIPSLVESYSMSLAEGMAVGSPCIATYTGAMPEVGGKDVLYFPVADVAACANSIRSIFTMEEDAIRNLSARLRMRSRSLHNPPKALARQLEIYNQIIGPVG